MKQLFSVLITMMVLDKTHAQLGPVEFVAGDQYLHYQHSIAHSFKPNSNFGWQHIATLIKRYNTNMEKGGFPDELMNQAYVTVRIHPVLSLKGGLFYTNVGGYQPTIGLQFFAHKKNWTAILAPRVDVVANGSYEMFVMVEFSPSLSQKIKLYTRLQAMSNFGKENHNRSYQQLRIGFEVKGFQLGGGVTLDEYGALSKVYSNTGVFLRRMF